MGLGKQIRKFRKQAQLTQPELAEKLGVHETTIRRWEQEKDGGPDSKTIHKLAEVLGVTPETLLSESSYTPLNAQEADGSNNMVVLSLGGDKSVKAPATQDGYAFLERLFLASLKAQGAAV